MNTSNPFAWNEGVIVCAIATQTLARKCLVIVPNCNWTGHECDVLGVTTDLRVIDIEVKISRSDLKADARKDKWWHHLAWREQIAGAQRTAREWPPKVWKHYYALPKEIWADSLLERLPSPRSGVILMEQRESATLPVVTRVVRRAQPCRDAAKISAAAAIDIARLANLRMWDAFASCRQAHEEARALRAAARQSEAA